MPERRKFKRKSGNRDSKLIIIAAEGNKTENIYFEGLKANYYDRRVHVEVLKRQDTKSDPARVLSELDRFRSEYKLRKGYDELWLVTDVDRWGNQKISEVSEKCFQKLYFLAVSNPSFEIWLLFHVKSLDDYEPHIIAELLENKKTGDRTRIDQELVKLLGKYNKSNPDLEFFLPSVGNAIINARNADHNPQDRWPNELGSRVYLLAEKIIHE